MDNQAGGEGNGQPCVGVALLSGEMGGGPWQPQMGGARGGGGGEGVRTSQMGRALHGMR